MSFAEPQWLWAAMLVPLGLVLFVRSSRGGDAADAAPGRARWLWVDARGARPLPPRRRHRAHGALAAVAWMLGIVALAQPQWGSREEVQFDQAREVLVALDLSRSMLAQDVPPSRLARARLLVESTLDELAGERVGLLVFSGTAFLQSPLSADHEVLRELLPVLEPGYLPESGTDFDAMIDAALQAFSQTGAADRYLVVLSDGESESFDPDAATLLREAGVRVIALGIGTESGALIPDPVHGIVKDDRGAAVLSRLERASLERLATETGGVYADAASWLDLAGLVERTVSEGRSGEFVERREKLAVHRFQWWLAPALLALLLSQLFELPALPRARLLRPHRDPAPPATAQATRVGVLALAVCTGGLVPGLAPAVRASTSPSAAMAAANAVPSASPVPSASTPSTEPRPNPILETVAALAERGALSPADHAALAGITLEVARAGREAGQALPAGAVRDALVSVDLGERLDAGAADWAQLRSGLESLLDAPPSAPPSESGQSQSGEGESPEQEHSGASKPSRSGAGSEAGESGESGREEGESGDSTSPAGEAGEGGRSSESAQASEDGSSQDAAPESGAQSDEAGGASGERERGDPRAMSDETAGLGSLDDSAADAAEAEREQPGSGESKAAADAAREADGESRPSRLVGGTRSESEALIQQRPDLAAAVGRMERVREGDAPAVLFDRMNTAEGKVDRDGGSRW